MPIRTVGEILSDGDFNDAVLTRTAIEAETWHDPEGDRGTRYASVAQALRAALRSGIYDVVLVVDEEDGTYAISIQYDQFA